MQITPIESARAGFASAKASELAAFNYHILGDFSVRAECVC